MAAGNRKRRERPIVDRHPRRKSKGECPTTGKIRYASVASALSAAASAARGYHHPMREYLCPFCGGWHLTSKPRR